MTYSEFRTKQQSFKSSEGTIKYIDEGEGSVVVLLHGIPTSGWLYRKMIGAISKHHRVIAPDMLGFGSSDSPKGYDIYKPEAHAERLLALMDSLQIDTWSHVFHDAGGLWTWELLKMQPQRIDRLIILNTIVYEAGFKPPIRFERGWLARFIMSLYSNGVTTNMMLKGLFKSGLMENNLTKEDLEGYKTPLKEGKTKAMYQFFSETCNDLPDYSDVITSLSMPKLLIWGKHDEFLVLDKMKDSVITDLKLSEDNVHLLEAKHFIQEEEPEQISSLILSFTNS
ncbi:alpha/beta fold hydrolase [Winogradskyella sp. 3972H.M.0a.05]|uniref:alpha/beta fold hydrolase n=1 Tax=Winogradskyella sp. 3972H.M.0a.05 TaxID=2950277 RepID=UPI00339564D6